MPTLPADAHVHSEFSWDHGSDPASPGSMRRTCEQAVRIGLPAIVFTDHLDDASGWLVQDGDIGHYAQKYVQPDGTVVLPPFDVDGYLESIERCRHDFPDLRILTGVEFGQPHAASQAARDILNSGVIDRVNGSLHMLPLGDGTRTEPTTLYRTRPADEVMRRYLDELPRMFEGDFEVLCHIDFAVRSWPVHEVGPFDPRDFEDGFRDAMRALAGTGRALELNTRRLAVDSTMVERGGRPGRVVRERQPRARVARGQLSRGDGYGGVVRVQGRIAPGGPMDPMTCPADAVGCSDTSTLIDAADPLNLVIIGLVALIVIVFVVRRLLSRR